MLCFMYGHGNEWIRQNTGEAYGGKQVMEPRVQNFEKVFYMNIEITKV